MRPMVMNRGMMHRFVMNWRSGFIRIVYVYMFDRFMICRLGFMNMNNRLESMLNMRLSDRSMVSWFRGII